MSSCLLIGPPGSGKTTAACTAPGPVGVIDFDYKLHKMDNIKHLLQNGQVIQIPINQPLSMMGLRRLATAKHETAKDLVQQRPQGYLDFVDVMEALEKDCTWGGVKLKTVVIDSYTSLQEHLKRMIMAANSKSSMTLPLYGVLLSNLEEVNNTLVRMPINVIVVAHEKADKNELIGNITYKAMVEGQMADKIGKDFEEIYFMQKVISGDGAKATAKYEMMTLGDSMRSARTSHNLPAIVEPDFSKIFK